MVCALLIVPALACAHTVIFTAPLVTSEQDAPFFTTTLYQRSAVRLPMSALVRVVVVLAMLVQLSMPLADHSHLTTVPTCPFNVRLLGCVLWQIVCALLIVPALAC